MQCPGRQYPLAPGEFCADLADHVHELICERLRARPEDRLPPDGASLRPGRLFGGTPDLREHGLQRTSVRVTLIHEAFQFRTILEAAAVRHFVTVADDATLSELERITTEVLRRLDGGNNADPRLLDAALKVDWSMHDMIVESVGNRIMMTAHRQNFDKIKMIRLHGRSPRYLPLAMEEHLGVIAAMKQRDPEKAAVALEHHMRCAERRALGL